MNENEPSRKDVALGVIFAVSGLLGFCLSFSLLQNDGRPYLFGFCVLTCSACLALATNKAGILLGFAAFLLTRLAWALAVTRW
jgi:hypothetical protein